MILSSWAWGMPPPPLAPAATSCRCRSSSSRAACSRGSLRCWLSQRAAGGGVVARGVVARGGVARGGVARGGVGAERAAAACWLTRVDACWAAAACWVSSGVLLGGDARSPAVRWVLASSTPHCPSTSFIIFLRICLMAAALNFQPHSSADFFSASMANKSRLKI